MSQKINDSPSVTVPNKPAKKTPDDYCFGKLLGEGSFANVYLAKDIKGHREYAIKVCEKIHIIREKKAESIQREKQVMTILSNNKSEIAPFFVNLYATFQDSERLYFVMTYAPCGELLKLLNSHKTFSLETSQFYAGEILQALCHLHNLNIVHRDLKPENILLNERGHILITDFGSAKILPTNKENSTETENKDGQDEQSTKKRKNSFVGTAQYVSPEVLQGKYSLVGPPADMWAFGCVVYQFLTGSCPFTGPNEYLIFQKILKVTYDFPADFNPDAQNIIESLLKLEPEERLGSKDVHRYSSVKTHDFFRGVFFDQLHSHDPPTFQPAEEVVSTFSSVGDGDVRPGFDPRIIAQRLLASDGDQPIIWANSRPSSDSINNTNNQNNCNKDTEADRPSKEPMDTKHPELLLESVIAEKLEQQIEKSPSSRCYCC